MPSSESPWNTSIRPDNEAACPVVLLGASGFVGRAIQAELERAGHPVVGAGSSEADLRAPGGLAWLRAAVRPNSVLIMAAAVTRDRDDSLEAFQANVAMTGRVAELVREVHLRQCLYLSSDAVYGDRRTNRGITEETPADPMTLYAAAKLAGELQIAAAACRTQTPVAILRLCRVYGPGDPHLTYGPAAFIRDACTRGVIELYGDGEEERDLVYRDDCAMLIRHVLARRLRGVYNLGSGGRVSFGHVAALIARMAPGSVRIIHRPRNRPIVHLGCDLGKLTSVLPEMRWTSLEAGLRRSVEAVPGMAEHVGCAR